jgi:hypothetical protein
MEAEEGLAGVMEDEVVVVVEHEEAVAGEDRISLGLRVARRT